MKKERVIMEQNAGTARTATERLYVEFEAQFQETVAYLKGKDAGTGWEVEQMK